LTNFYKSIKEVGEVVSEGIPAKVPNLADEVSAPEVAAKKFFGWFDDIRRRLENEYHPVEKVARIVKKKGMALPSLEDPEILVKRNLGSTGIAEAELYGLGDIIRPHAGEIDNLKTYLKSKRAIDLEERGIKTGIKLEDAQAAVKQFANQFEDTAQRLYMYQRSILHNYLVQTGMLSEETFQKIIAANPNYVPFKRLFEEAGITEFVPKKKAGVPIKRIKGSEREILDPLESIIENTYKAVTAGEQNRLWRSVAQIGEQFPELGIKKIKPKIFPVGTIEHRAAIDKQYIDEVSKFAKNLGAKIKTGGQVGRALGYFHHAGDVVERKFATPEEVISHEVGHFLDKKYSLKQRFYQRGKTKTVGQEITQFMRDQGQSSNRVKKVSERFATAFEWWLSNRNLAEKDIPLFSKEIEKIIGEIPELKPLINIRPRPGLSVETMSQKIFAKSTFKPTPNSISFFDNGEQVFYEVPEEIAKVANSLGNVQNIVFKLLSYPTKLVRTGATGISPEFGLIRNPLRDQFTALWNSESGYKPFLDLLRGISHYSGNDDLYRMYLGSGAGQSYFVSLDREFKAKTLDELLKGTTFIRKGTGLLGILQDISQVTEAGTRLGEYQKALQKTGDPWQAAKAAREVTVDFSRIGKDFRVANQLIAFINARVQGTIQAVKSAIKHPARAGILGVSLGVVPATLLYLHNRQYKEWYDIEDWEKRNNWIVLYGKPGEAKMFEIPKDFIIGKLFGSTTENFLSFIDKTDPKALENLAGNILDFFSPVTNLGEALPAAIKPIVEHVANYNFFLGRELVPEYMKARPTAGQYFKGTREIAKVIGSRIGVAPTVVDNYLYSYLPGVFTGVINLVDYALGGKIFEDVAKLPFIRVFSVSGTGKISREIKSAFYNLRDKRMAISSIAKSEIYSKEEKVRLIGAVIKSMANDIKIMNGYLQAAAGKKPVFEITPEPKVPYEAPGIARKAGAAIAAAPPQQGLLAPAAQPLYRVSGKKVKVPALKTTRLKIKKIIKPTKKKVVYRIKAMEKMPTIPRTTLPKL
jgi:hypothetical protein